MPETIGSTAGYNPATVEEYVRDSLRCSVAGYLESLQEELDGRKDFPDGAMTDLLDELATVAEIVRRSLLFFKTINRP